MNAMLDSAVVWLLWTGVWWAVLALGLAVWFRVKPPQTTAVRHAALAAAIVAGTLAGMLPRWGSGVMKPPELTAVAPSDVVPEPMELEVVQNILPASIPDSAPAAGGVNTVVPGIEVPTPAVIPVTPWRDWFALGKNMIAAAWVLGALILSVRLIHAARMTLRWRREAIPLPEGEQAVFVALRQELRVRRATNAGSHAEPASPVVLCGWPPLVLVPSDWLTWEPESRCAAWRHELAHVRRRDDWWRMLSEGLRVLWWFHPGVRWLLSRREHEAELLSDEAAVAAGCPPQELAQVLLDACRRPQSAVWTAPAGTFFSPRTMKQRIARLLDAPSAEALCRPAPRGLRLAAFAGMALLALAGSMRWITAANPAAPVDLTKLERTIAKEPTYQSKHPMYCLLAFGKNAEPRWLVLDIVTEPNTNSPAENVAYFDRDGDGDLTKPGNRIVSTSSKKSATIVTFSPKPIYHYEPQFDIGDIFLADGTKHTKFTLEVGGYVQDYRQVAFRLLLRGQHDQLVAYAPGASLLRFGDSPTDAPIVHLDGPLTFCNYVSDGRLSIPTCPFPRGTLEGRKWCEANPPTYGVEKLLPGEKFDIQAELGTFGLGRGTFAKLSRNMPPEDVHPQAELMLPGGKTLSVALTLRHATTMFSGAVLIPEGTPPGKATITLSFPDWADGKVKPATDEIEVGAAKDEPKVPRLEPDRKARVGESLGVQIAAYPVVPRGGNPTTVEKDGTIRVADLPPIVVEGKTAEEIESLILQASRMHHQKPMHVAICFLRAAADVADPPAKVAEPVKKRPNYVMVVGQLLDAETGKPIEKAGWEWGMFDPKKPDQIAWGHSRQSGGNYPGGKFEMLLNIGANGHHYPLRVYSAGYETMVVVDKMDKPYPEKIERTVRLKRGRNITGVLRDHAGKPVANGWVFFIPKGHHSNIVEGIPGTDAHDLPGTVRDDVVAEVRTNDNGTFALATGADGTLAASTNLVDLWPFPLPEDGHADLKMPAPSYLVIDLTYWYLDELVKKGKRELSPESEDPNQCWIQVDQSGSADPLWKNLGYRRQMLVFAHDPRAKLSKGVIVGHVIEGEMGQPIPDVGHNKNLSTKVRVALPPGSYRVQRLRAGPFAPVDEQTVVLMSGEDTVMSWARGDGSSVRGKATWPANMMFVRQPDEKPRKLDWTVPDTATVWISPVAGGKPIEAAKIQPDGSFFIATNLDPGKYKATARVYLPESDFRGGWRTADCEFSQEFTVPDPLRGPSGSPPVNVEIAMQVGKGGRFVAAEAPPAAAAPPKKEEEDRFIKVTGQVLDDATGKPIETCHWESGSRDPKDFANVLWGHSYGSQTNRDGKFSTSVWVNKDGVHTRMRVKVAGYESAVVVGDLPQPLPASVERIVRLKRTGKSVSGVVRDHQGKPAAGANVFFIPDGHSSNIVEGISAADYTQLPDKPREQRISRDGNVAETVADAQGRFTMPIAGTGTLAASTDQIDLWPFPMPAEGQPAKLTMPAPATLVVELDEWRLDGLYRKPKNDPRYAAIGNPQECWLQVTGWHKNFTGDEAVDARLRRAWHYERPMFVFAPGGDLRISRGVSIGESSETSKPEPIPGIGANKRLQAKVRILLPPANYSIGRTKLGARGVEVASVTLKPGEVFVLDRWKRPEGTAVRGTVKLPANMQFVRQPGEAPKKLDWTVPQYWAYVWIRSADRHWEEYATVDTEGRFSVPTHLPPGKYLIQAYAMLPSRDRSGKLESLGVLGDLPERDLEHAAQELVIPEPAPGPAGSPPVEIEMVMMAVGKRIVAAPPKSEIPANADDPAIDRRSR